MADDISPEMLRAELASLRADLGGISPLKDSEWSAHANWKSKGSSLLGDYSISSRVRQAEGVQLSDETRRIISDSTSDRFLEVTRSLSEMLRAR